MIWPGALRAGEYQNPIIFEDYSDPDAIRVGNDFWMTASSFNFLPGLPILHSRDLVNWSLVGNAVRRLPFPAYDRVAHGCGIWAPSLRFHNGKFWVFFGMPDEGIFEVHCDDPRGNWSELNCVLEMRGYIDPCPIWLDDGRAFIVHAYAKSRIGIKSRLGAFEFDPDTRKAIGGDRMIYDGQTSQPTIEGPKLYRRGNYYYIFAPAGGVAQGWQTVLRSESPFGPFEERIVMEQGSSPTNGPHQGALVDAPDGKQWFMHFQDMGPWGRITHLQPVQWRDDWPIIGQPGASPERGNPVSRWTLPMERESNSSLAASVSPGAIRDEFRSPILSDYWQWPANPRDEWFAVDADAGSLRLYGQCAVNDSLWSAPALLSRRIPSPEFSASVHLSIGNLLPGERSGFAIMGREYAFIEVVIGQNDASAAKLRIGVGKSTPVPGATISGGGAGGQNSTSTEDFVQIMTIPETLHELELTVVWNAQANYQFEAKDAEGKLLCQSEQFAAVAGVWVGARIGLYAMSCGINLKSEDHVPGWAEFSHFVLQ